MDTRTVGALVATGFIGLLLVVLIASSHIQRVGDGSEYLAMTAQLAHGRPPALSPHELRLEMARQQSLGDGFAGISLTHPALASSGRQDFDHFWMYSLLAVPFYGVTHMLGIHPAWAFVVLNALLYLVAVWLCARRMHWAAVMLIFAGPCVWWVDKAHTEVFTFTLLAIAFALARERPWWSLVALALASTQNPPIALAVPLFAVVAVGNDRSLLQRRAFLLGAGSAVALAALHPAYYLLRLGVLTPQSASGVMQYRIPSVHLVFGWVVDPSIGLLVGFPLLVPAVIGVLVAMLIHARRSLTPWTWALAPALAVYFLVSFSQTVNVNSGATPLIARYGLWLIPLTVPLFMDATVLSRRAFAAMLGPVAVVSAVWMLAVYAPARAEQYTNPNWLVRWIWTEHPGLDNPSAEIFAERTAHTDWSFQSVATPSCSKVLVVNGVWPASCARKPVLPHWCARKHDQCYANASGRGYDFVTAPD